MGILTPRSFGSLYRNLRPLLIAFVEGDMYDPQASTTTFTDRAEQSFKLLRRLNPPPGAGQTAMPTCVASCYRNCAAQRAAFRSFSRPDCCVSLPGPPLALPLAQPLAVLFGLTWRLAGDRSVGI